MQKNELIVYGQQISITTILLVLAFSKLQDVCAIHMLGHSATTAALEGNVCNRCHSAAAT